MQIRQVRTDNNNSMATIVVSLEEEMVMLKLKQVLFTVMIKRELKEEK